jgi:hypothetical protein
MEEQITSANGDINNDGYRDIAIFGHPLTGDTLSFAVYIYLGGAQPDNLVDYILQSPVPCYDWPTYGLRIDYSNDINGDAIDDLVISEYDAGYTNHGNVYIYFGGSNFDVVPDMVLYGYDYDYGDPWIQCFGVQLNTSGDFNGDGFNDLVIGSLADYNGQVNIFYGGPQFDNVSDWSYHGTYMEVFGGFVVGDINNDGYGDLCTLSPYETSVNEVRIFYGSVNFNNTPDWTHVYNTDLQQLFAMNQDINDDGIVDLLVYKGHVAFKCLWGNQSLLPELTSIIPVNYNLYKKYYAYFNNEWYLSLDDYQHGAVKFYHYDVNTGSSLDYVITEDYNPNGGFSASYFLGDVNGDNRNEVLLGSLSQGPAQFKIFTDPNTAIADDFITGPDPQRILCYPNPFIDQVNILYRIEKLGDYTINIYNIKGQLITTLTNGIKEPGNYHTRWDGTNDMNQKLPCGVYIIQVITPSYTDMIKTTFINKQ